MNFTYQVSRVNTHEPSIDVLYTHATLQARFGKVWYDPTHVQSIALEDVAGYFETLIIQQAPYHSWDQESAINAEGMIDTKLAPLADRTNVVTEEMIAVSEVRPTATLETAKTMMWGQIETWRAQEENGTVVFEHMGHEWEANKPTYQRMVQTLGLSDLPPGFIWTNHTNVDVPVTKMELQVLFDHMNAAMVQRGYQIHLRQREMKNELMGLTTVEDVLGYVIGW